MAHRWPASRARSPNEAPGVSTPRHPSGRGEAAPMDVQPPALFPPPRRTSSARSLRARPPPGDARHGSVHQWSEGGARLTQAIPGWWSSHAPSESNRRCGSPHMPHHGQSAENCDEEHRHVRWAEQTLRPRRWELQRVPPDQVRYSGHGAMSCSPYPPFPPRSPGIPVENS